MIKRGNVWNDKQLCSSFLTVFSPAEPWCIEGAEDLWRKIGLCVLRRLVREHSSPARCPRRLITAHNGRSPEQARNWIRGRALGSSDLMSAKEGGKGEQIAGDNAGLLMGKDQSAQLRSPLVLLISYIYSKWTVCTSGPTSDSRIPSKIKYQA